MNKHPLSNLISNQDLLKKIAEQFGTPLYVYSENRLKANISRLSTAIGNSFKNHQVYYAVKANSNLAVLQTLARAGSGFAIVSGGELARVLAAGGDPAGMVFSGVGKAREEMAAALDAG